MIYETDYFGAVQEMLDILLLDMVDAMPFIDDKAWRQLYWEPDFYLAYVFHPMMADPKDL